MDIKELTTKTHEISVEVARHNEQIKTLFSTQAEIKVIAESTHELAQAVKELSVRLRSVENNIEIIENEKRQKGFAVWQIIVSAVLGGTLTYVVSTLLR